MSLSILNYDLENTVEFLLQQLGDIFVIRIQIVFFFLPGVWTAILGLESLAYFTQRTLPFPLDSNPFVIHSPSSALERLALNQLLQGDFN